MVTDFMISLGSCSSQLPNLVLFRWERPWMLLNLSEFFLMGGNRVSLSVENDKPSRGGSLNTSGPSSQRAYT